MMMSRYREKELERKERRIQRDERENAAGKLVQKIPDLTSLSIAIHETRPEGCVSDNHYIRRVALEHAPALFEVACSDPRCEDGGHDVTREILASLASRQACFEGRHACRGRCGAIDCARVLWYVTTASYRSGGRLVDAANPTLPQTVATGGSQASGDRETFALGWVKAPGSLSEAIGSVTLPTRPTTLGEARGGLEMIADDAQTACWLQSWAGSQGEERDIVLRLPGGWFVLCAATIAVIEGAREHYMIRFDRRCLVKGPAEQEMPRCGDERRG